MEFNNSRFEANAKTSMNTLERLKQALNFTGAEKSLNSLDSAGRKFNLAGVGNALETVTGKFSAFEIMAVTALSNITNRAVNAGVAMVKSMSVDQIAAGWNKYAEKTTAVQTIMAATADTWEASARAAGFDGSQMEYVNSQMEKLNWFTDETSYNFVDMVSNIGKFTANNIPLQDAVTSMQGIANWAAISGQNAGAASRAMYNLSQALGVGSVKLMDWRSIENANMATSEFKKKVLEVAAANGKISQDANGVYKTLEGTEVTVESFSQTLSEGWFDKKTLIGVLDLYGGFTNELYTFSEATGLTATQILQLVDANSKGTLSTETLRKTSRDTGVSVDDLKKGIDKLGSSQYDFGRKAFKAAQEAKTFEDAINATKDAASTGWMNIFETIFGDYEKAKVLWTDFANFLYDSLVSPLEKVQELLDGWADTKGLLFDIINLDENANPVNYNLDTAIGQYLNTANEQIKSGVSEVETLSQLFSRLEMVGLDTKEVRQKILDYAKVRGILKEIANDTYINLLTGEQFTANADNLDTVISKIGIPLDQLLSVISKFEVAGRDYIFGNEEYGIIGAFTYLKAAIWGLDDLGTEGILGAIKSAADEAFDKFDYSNLINASIAFNKFTKRLILGEGPLADIKNAFTGLFTILQQVKDFISQIWHATEPVRKALGNLAGAFLNLFGKIGLALSQSKAFSDVYHGFLDAVQYVSDAIANFINYIAEKISNSELPNLSDILSIITQPLVKLFETIGKLDFNKLGENLSVVFDKIGEAFSKLKEATGNINLQKIIEFFDTIVNDIFEKLKRFKEFLKEFFGDADIYKFLKDFIKFGGLVGANTQFVKILSNFAAVPEKFGGLVDNISKNITNLGGIKDVFESISKIFSGDGAEKKIDSSKILDFAKAVGILAVSLFVLSLVDGNKLLGAVGALGSMVGILVLVINTINTLKLNKKEVLTATAAIAGLAVSMLIMAASLAVFTLIAKSADNAIAGVLTMAIVLGMSIVAIELLGKAADKVGKKNILTAVGALLIMATAITVLAIATAIFVAVAKSDNLVKGLALMAGSLLVISGAFALLGYSTKKIGKANVLTAAGSLLIMATAMIAIAAAVAIFVAIAGSDNAWKGFALMAATITVMATSLALLGAITKELGAGRVLAAVTAIIAISAAMVILSVALGAFTLIAGSGNSWTGFALMAATITAIATSLALLGAITKEIGVGNILAAVGALLIASVAITVLAVAMAAFTLVASGDNAMSSIFLLAGALVVMTAACYGLSFIAGPVLAGAGAMLVMALAIGVLSIAIFALNMVLPDFSNAIALFGEGIFKLVEGIALGIIALGNAIGTAIYTILEKVGSGVGKLIEKIGEGIGLGFEKIGEGITRIGDGIGDIGDGIGDIGDGLIRFSIGAKSLEDVKWLSIGASVAGFATDLGKLKKNSPDFSYLDIDKFVASIELLIGGLENLLPNLETMGEKWDKAISDGLRHGLPHLKLEFSAIQTALINTARGYYNSWYSIGQDAMSGYADGIKGSSKNVNSSVSTVIKGGINSAKAAQQSKSPSKIYAELGGFGGQGYANGWLSKAGVVEDAVSEVVSSPFAIAEYTANAIQAILSSDFTPTIRPVLDFESIRQQAGAINGLIPETSISGVRQVSSQYRSMNANQNGSDMVTGSPINNYFTIYASEGQDANDLANAISRKINASVERRKSVWK
jgi:hypothetical protein